MKKLLALVLVLALVLSSSALALNYTNKLGNEATFETLEEAREGAAAGSRAGSNPCLDAYPAGTTFVYRSADLWGKTAAVRMNTNILVYTDAKFETKDDAFAYLKDLGLIDIIDKAIGAVVLVTPSGARGYAAADARAYYLLQTAMFNSSYGEYNYMGAFNWRYVIGIGGGATFLNNYVATTLDFVGRNAGMLLIDGTMNTELYDVATYVPVMLANASDAVIAEYKAANGTNAYVKNMDVEVYYNQEFPLRSVVVTESDDYKALIEYAYYNLFIKAQRIPVLQSGVNSIGTEYSGYGNDEAPFSLCDRDAIIDGKTDSGIYLFTHVEDTLSEIATSNGEYLETWYEFLPEEVLNGTAGEHTVPLWLANHGGGDDPIQFVDEIGLLDLAGDARFAIVAPYYQSMYAGFGGGSDSVPLCKALCALVHYMLDTYPALDPSRVYVTGYSLGGGATFHAIMQEPALFAAAVPMSAAGYEGNEEQNAAFNVALPLMVTTSSYDLGGAFDTTNHHISIAYTNTINKYAKFAGMDTVEEFDFEAYDLSGFDADIAKVQLLNGEYFNHSFFLAKDGAPFIGVAYTENTKHALYPEFAKLAWDWAKHFSRNQETLEIEFDGLMY